MKNLALFRGWAIVTAMAIGLSFSLAACTPTDESDAPTTEATAESESAEAESTEAESTEAEPTEAESTEVEPTEAEPTATEAAAVGSPITITATEFEYDAPARILGGMTEIEFVNEGEFAHGLVFARLGEGKTTDDLLEVLADEDAPIPDWLSFPGGIGGIDPGQSATAFLDLEPGEYAIFSFESSEGEDTPDAARGMLQTIEVTEVAEEQATPPQADTTIALVDFSFIPVRPIQAGRQVLRFENGGKQPHEALIMRPAEGMTADEVIGMMMQFGAPPPEGAAGEGEAEEGTPDSGEADEGAPAEGAPEGGPPPFASAGGMTPIDVGASSFLEMDFEPGEYLFICFIPDPADGTPHMAKGMVQAFTVE